jgi:alginate O-acetyltransferase complex protein AlgI
MLFNSAIFLYLFLPFSILLYFNIGKKSAQKARIFLAIMSLIFYAYWDIRFLPLIVISIMVNYYIGLKVINFVDAKVTLQAKQFLMIGLIFNLALLIFFKYTNMLVTTISDFGIIDIDIPNIILPIGISFFTFTQIAFLVDAYQNKVRDYKLWDYMLFVSYFPHQIAGPILHHKEMMSQFTKQLTVKFNLVNFTVGISMLAFGLAKKVLIADTLSSFCNPVFANLEMGVSPTFIEAWTASCAYSLQLYFDFSAYCDMAIGISLIFNIKLPLNFNSPYKSFSIIEFWRRWHMTLSRFLRDYLYIPLGGNRNGNLRRYLNLFVTMALGGIWHGASWTFLFWGMLHGFYLVVNHFWRGVLSTMLGINLPSVFAWFLTMIAVIIGWVFFRAETLSGALLMLESMFLPSQILLPPSVFKLASLSRFFVASDGWSGSVGGIQAIGFVALISLMVIVMPNIQQLFRKYKPFLDEKPEWSNASKLTWSTSWLWATVTALLLAFSLVKLGTDSSFLYFNF